MTDHRNQLERGMEQDTEPGSGGLPGGNPVVISRRRFLELGAFAVAAVAAVTAFPFLAEAGVRPSVNRLSTQMPTRTPTGRPPDERTLSFHNTHTGESLRSTYWVEGRYDAGAMEEISHLLRDHRTGETKSIDPALIDFLHSASGELGSSQSFHVISGYRSPSTNAILAEKSRGVARRSLHIQGKAIDVYLPDRSLEQLRRVAMAMGRGGVGFYPKPNFVHLDVGRVRNW